MEPTFVKLVPGRQDSVRFRFMFMWWLQKSEIDSSAMWNHGETLHCSA